MHKHRIWRIWIEHSKRTLSPVHLEREPHQTARRLSLIMWSLSVKHSQFLLLWDCGIVLLLSQLSTLALDQSLLLPVDPRHWLYTTQQSMVSASSGDADASDVAANASAAVAVPISKGSSKGSGLDQDHADALTRLVKEEPASGSDNENMKKGELIPWYEGVKKGEPPALPAVPKDELVNAYDLPLAAPIADPLPPGAYSDAQLHASDADGQASEATGSMALVLVKDETAAKEEDPKQSDSPPQRSPDPQKAESDGSEEEEDADAAAKADRKRQKKLKKRATAASKKKKYKARSARKRARTPSLSSTTSEETTKYIEAKRAKKQARREYYKRCAAANVAPAKAAGTPPADPTLDDHGPPPATPAGPPLAGPAVPVGTDATYAAAQAKATVEPKRMPSIPASMVLRTKTKASAPQPCVPMPSSSSASAASASGSQTRWCYSVRNRTSGSAVASQADAAPQADAGDAAPQADDAADDEVQAGEDDDEAGGEDPALAEARTKEQDDILAHNLSFQHLIPEGDYVEEWDGYLHAKCLGCKRRRLQVHEHGWPYCCNVCRVWATDPERARRGRFQQHGQSCTKKEFKQWDSRKQVRVSEMTQAGTVVTGV